MTEVVTREEHVRNALRRLNPEFHEHDTSWPSFDAIVNERDELRAHLKVALDKLEERLLSEQVDWMESKWIEQVREKYAR